MYILRDGRTKGSSASCGRNIRTLSSSYSRSTRFFSSSLAANAARNAASADAAAPTATTMESPFPPPSPVCCIGVRAAETSGTPMRSTLPKRGLRKQQSVDARTNSATRSAGAQKRAVPLFRPFLFFICGPTCVWPAALSGRHVFFILGHLVSSAARCFFGCGRAHVGHGSQPRARRRGFAAVWSCCDASGSGVTKALSRARPALRDVAASLACGAD